MASFQKYPDIKRMINHPIDAFYLSGYWNSILVHIHMVIIHSKAKQNTVKDFYIQRLFMVPPAMHVNPQNNIIPQKHNT